MKAILVVEDEGLIADDIRRRLERFGYCVPAIASSGEEALRIARSREFDLVLMDIRLKGGLDGIAAAHQISNEFRIPVVYLTAHADEDTISRATVTEPFGYILKPVADGNLRSAVQIAIYKHEMERRLRASESWLSTTLRSIGDGIIATDPDGCIKFLNPEAERLTGWTAGSAAGRQLPEVLNLRVDGTGEPAPNPVCDLFPDEVRAYDLQGLPVELQCFDNSAGGESFGAIVVVRDIRERRETEALRAFSGEEFGEKQRCEPILVNDVIAELAGSGIAIQSDGSCGIIHTDPGRFRQMLAILAQQAERIESSVLDLEPGQTLARRYGGTWFVKLRSSDALEILWPCIGVRHGEGASTVLLIEDEDALRRDMSATLATEGFQVLAAKTVEHGSLIAGSHGQPIALVIAPEPLVGCPGNPITLRIAGYRHDGSTASGCLAKPFPMGEFRRRVRELVDRA